MAKKRIGILTGGGDCPGLNAAIRAVTKSAIEKSCEVIGFFDGYRGLVENHFIRLDNSKVSGILTQGGTILGTSNTANPFRWAYRGKHKAIRFRDVSKKALANYRKENLEGLIVVGGDGTLTIAKRLFQQGLPIVGIPKTIDNDLAGTDLTFGFETAVITATEAIDKIHSTAESHHRAMVVEVMGRYAGWIALYAGVASGGDIILIPEIPYEMKYVTQKIRERYEMGKKFSIIAVAEGARPRGGRVTVAKRVLTSTDPIRLGGIGQKVATEIEKKMGIESRAIVLGHVQRGGTPTPFDRVLATRFGTKALELVVDGDFGKMVACKNNDLSAISLEEATGVLKLVPLDHPLILAAQAVGTSFGFE